MIFVNFVNVITFLKKLYFIIKAKFHLILEKLMYFIFFYQEKENYHHKKLLNIYFLFSIESLEFIKKFRLDYIYIYIFRNCENNH